MNRRDVTTSRRSARRGFTLVEVLAALLLVAIVLPVVMRGVSIGTTSAAASRRRTEAASLAQSKLAELVATGAWRTGPFAGRFDPVHGENAHEYAWRADVRAWSQRYVRQMDVRVTWESNAGEQGVTLSTLVYEGKPEEASGTPGDAATGGTP